MVGPRPMVHIREPSLIRQMLANFNLFQKPILGNPLRKVLARGLASVDGDQWVKHRKIINPALYVEKLKHMLPAFHISCHEMISKWEGITKGGSCEVDVYPHLQTITSDVISRTAFGSCYEEGRKIFELQMELAKLVIKVAQSLYIPRFRFLPTQRNRRIKEIDNEVKNSIRNIIIKCVTSKEAGEDIKEDLLGLLLDSNDKEIKQQGDKKSGLSIDGVIEECKLFYFAGQETSANFIVWTMVMLGQHANWQYRARDEILKVFGDQKPNIEGLGYLKIGDDVNEFNPGRFVEGVSKATESQVSYFPFGAGPRMCVGQKFAMLEAKLAFVMILRRFSFELSPSYLHAPHTIITLQPEFGAQFILSEL